MHTIVCCLANETTVRTMCKNISNYINIIVLPYNKITYNELNNVLLTTAFWNDTILGENLIIYNENILFLDNTINDLVDVDCLGYELPYIFTFNNCSNGYGDFTIRKKSLVLETLNNISLFTINHCLCDIFINHFCLENIPEDIIYSYYIFNIRNNKENVNYLEDMKKNIVSLNKKIRIVNYKFHDIDNFVLKLYISEFLNIKH